ncbi:MAG: energy-coupling factor transporter transmembrane protein EcfT [Chloroflexi bacterium]|nr:energy-coupling factor transporter transmembrane protein EcfT [Chloroflexota bacterium]
MRLATPLEVDTASPLGGAHPLAKLGSAAALMLALFITVDAVTAAVVLAALVASFPLTGLRPAAFLRRVAPLASAAAAIAVINALFAADARGVIAGIAVALRLIGIAVAGLLAVLTIDPTDLADALVQHVRAPPRFVVGALAAWRLAPIFGQEWQTLAMARRARGIEAERGLADRLSSFQPLTFALLVGAIRRATRLALAMDARGFGRRPCRTIARARPFDGRDRAILAGGIAIAAGASLFSMALGTWRPLLAP